MLPGTLKLITFARFESFTIVRKYQSFGIYRNHSLFQTTKRQNRTNIPMLGRLGSNVRQSVHCLDCTYVQDVFSKMMLPTADIWVKIIFLTADSFAGWEILVPLKFE